MNQLPLEKQVRIISMLVEGCSMRATARVCDVSGYSAQSDPLIPHQSDPPNYFS
jgi:hypothetical protein